MNVELFKRIQACWDIADVTKLHDFVKLMHTW